MLDALTPARALAGEAGLILSAQGGSLTDQMVLVLDGTVLATELINGSLAAAVDSSLLREGDLEVRARAPSGVESNGLLLHVGASPASATWYVGDGFHSSTLLTEVHVYNPNRARAQILVRYLTANGPLNQPAQVDPQQAMAINPSALVPDRVDFSVEVTADVPVVVAETITHTNHAAQGMLGTRRLATEWFIASSRSCSDCGTYVQVGNPGQTAANTTTIFYREGSSETSTKSLSAPPGKRVTASPPSWGTGAMWAWVTSQLPVVVSVSNTRGNPTTWMAQAAGESQALPAWYVPWMVVSPADTSVLALAYPNGVGNARARVTLTAHMESGTEHTTSVDVPARNRITVSASPWLGGETGSFWVSIASDLPVVAASLTGPVSGTLDVGGSGGVAQLATDLMFAGGSTRDGRSAVLHFCNPGTADALVEILATAGTTELPVTDQVVIPAGQVQAWPSPGSAQLPLDAPSLGVWAHSDLPIAGVQEIRGLQGERIHLEAAIP